LQDKRTKELYIMAQIDNFRKVLGLPDPEKGQEETEQETPGVKKEPRISSRRDGRLIKSITIDEATHAKLKALSFWLYHHGGRKVTMSALVVELVDSYLKDNPDAKRFVETNS